MIAIREKNCGNCEYCVRSSTTRFRCKALPTDPTQIWNGNPAEHWCGLYWTAATSTDTKSSTAVKIPSKKD